MRPGSTVYVFGVHPLVIDEVVVLRGVVVALGRLGGVHRASVDLELLTSSPRQE